jgi:hypothetical protein
MSKEVFPDDMGLAPYVDFAHPLSAVSHKVPPKLSAISSVFKTDPISGFKSCDHTAVAQKRDSVAISISETHTRCLGQYQSAISAYFTNSTESTVCPSPLILTCAPFDVEPRPRFIYSRVRCFEGTLVTICSGSHFSVSAAFPMQGKTPVSLIHFDHDASNRSLYFSWP